jgi:UPF0755 protein
MFASILQNKLNIDSAEFVRLCNDTNICNKFKIDYFSLEGYLKPATYNFSVDMNVLNIINILVGEQMKELNKYENEYKKNNFNKHQILTLASIIEAETPVINERKKVSGVYHNRLNKKIPLCADPTIQYILEKHKSRLLYSDLEINSPYNTYKNVGLPPAPINSPSPSSIEAAIYPEEHKYYYFVAKGDGTNTHNFANTHEEHLKNKTLFNKRRN